MHHSICFSPKWCKNKNCKKIIRTIHRIFALNGAYAKRLSHFICDSLDFVVFSGINPVFSAEGMVYFY
ncbi:hypothetical protein D1151_03800 [Emergencia sp. 1XD21-10]|nr:hypothetical protein [Emergencia sp. 1XD21-10]